MYCPQCGGANDDTAGVCATCGLDLEHYRRQWRDTGAQAVEQVGAEGYPARSMEYSPPPYQHQYQGAYQAPPYEPSPYRQAGQPGSIPHIPSYLGWAIAVLILCFWPTGIAAVVYASQVDNKLIRGDIAGARESSRKAKMWCWISFGIAIGFVVLAIVIAVIAAITFSGSSVYTF